MFEFAAAYMDKNGNAPQVGDNDSGRLFIFNSDFYNNPYSNENNHSYLLDFAEHIFDYNFRSQCKIRNKLFLNFLPNILKIKLDEIKVEPKPTEKSLAFEIGGAYLLKNNRFNVFISCFPIGQDGKGGHNNLDTGNFTLSINGKQIIVDPGTGTYTRNKIKRDKFRSYSYHNTLFTSEDEMINLNKQPFWGLSKYYDYNVKEFLSDKFCMDIFFSNDRNKRTREFIINNHSFILRDFYDGSFFSRLNFNPELKIISLENNRIEFEIFSILINNHQRYDFLDYEFSPYYDKVMPGKCVVISSKKSLQVEFRIHT